MSAEDTERSVLSPLDRRRPVVGNVIRVGSVAVVLGLVIACAGPLLWLAKSAVSTTQDTLREPLALWPNGIQLSNLWQAWTRISIGAYLVNTILIVVGIWLFSLVVALTGAYTISVLRPRFAKVLWVAILATMFIPGSISLVSSYLNVLKLPIIGVNLVDTYWALWLPGSVSAFNILIVTRFFDALPRELFEAARIDGAGHFRVFWSLVLPLSKPIIGVVSLLTVIGAWQSFLWPLLVLPSPNLQPLSVALPRLEKTAEMSLLMAGLFIATLIPIALFLTFSRQFLHGAAQAGALKG